MYSHVVLVTGARTWDAEPTMRHEFRELWRAWGPSVVTRPLLISGGCPNGADAMAERLWHDQRFELEVVPADWNRHGRKAGPIRNQQLVDLARGLAGQGSIVVCATFLDLCRNSGCSRDRDQQLMPYLPGHFSHGTVDARARAQSAGLRVVDTVHPSLPPF